MKTKLFAVISLLIFTQMQGIAQAGLPDNTFDKDGKLTTLVGDSAGAKGYAAVVQPDGKILVAGESLDSGHKNFCVVRYKSNGKPDKSFGINGVVKIIFDYPSSASSIKLLQTGKIIVAGNLYVPYQSDFAAVRLNKNGTPDSSFGNNGKVIASFGEYDYCTAAAVQADGKIILSGYYYGYIANTRPRVCLIRLQSNGNFDSTFGDNGKQIHKHSNSGEVAMYGYGMALQPNGKIIISGIFTSASSAGNFLTIRLNNNGTPDKSFSQDGEVVTNPAPALFIPNSSAYSVAIQPDSKILVAGNVVYYNELSWGNKDFAMVRYLSNGTIDSSFGINGAVITDLTHNIQDDLSSIILQPDGKILAGGSFNTSYYSTYPPSDFALVRYLQNGKLDSAFANNGVAITDFGNIESGKSLAIQPDGNIILAGFKTDASKSYIAVVRYKGSNNLQLSQNTSTVNIQSSPEVTPVINLYPNPVQNLLHIEGLNTGKNTVLSIVDINGKLLYKTSVLAASYTWNIKKLMPGTYYLLSEANKKTSTLKFIKE